MSGQIHADFLRLLWVLVDKQLRLYYESMGKEDKIRNEDFRWAFPPPSPSSFLFSYSFSLPLSHSFFLFSSSFSLSLSLSALVFSFFLFLPSHRQVTIDSRQA